MKYISSVFITLILFSMLSCSDSNQQEQPTNMDIPAWAQDAVWYQIFVERFRNGDPDNNPTLAFIQGSWPMKFEPDWAVRDWTSDWYANPKNLEPKKFYDLDIQSRRYGGDLQGVIDKLDYLKSLGINAIYFNPLNDAASMHKFDARNYRHIDINFGPDPEGDLKIIANENPLDPHTWQWTSADQLFLDLIKEIHARNMRLVVDYSWNHTGTSFFAWSDIIENGKQSKFADWYEVNSFDDPNTEKNEFSYAGWAGVKYLPELKKVDVENRIHGKPYKGNIHPEVKQHIFHVTKRWLDPNNDGNLDDGIDGFRLDVADQIGMDFWREYRKYVRSINPEALLIGEIWWEKWPDKLMDPRPYVVHKDVFDIVMFYQAYKPARAFFAKTSEYDGAEGLVKGWDAAVKGIADETVKSMMVMSASHDSPRLLTSFQNKGQYKYHVKPTDNPDYFTGKPDQETMDRMKLYLIYQFCMPGAPQIYAGDEMGMWGGDDPDCRKPLWWDDLTFENETADPFKKEAQSYPVGFNQELNRFYKSIIKIRHDNPVLKSGRLEFLQAKGDLLIFERKNDQSSIVVVINNSSEKLSLKEQMNFTGLDLITKTNVDLSTIKALEPLSALVLLVEK